MGGGRGGQGGREEEEEWGKRRKGGGGGGGGGKLREKDNTFSGYCWHEEIEQGPQLSQVVLEWRSSQQQTELRLEKK